MRGVLSLVILKLDRTCRIKGQPVEPAVKVRTMVAVRHRFDPVDELQGFYKPTAIQIVQAE